MARILVVDDEAGLREFLADALEDEGHAVTEAGDGEEALAKLRASGYDLVLTDLRMPKLSGLDLLQRIAAEQPETEVVVLTAHGSIDSAVEAMRLGAFDYLEKPLGSPAELRLVVARALERRTLRTLREGSRRQHAALPPLTFGDPVMRPVVEALHKVARTDATVVLLGESGTGKELAARTLHAASARASAPFVAVNGAAIAAQLLESELFGHEKGAFTGAVAQRRGRLELAAGGSFFLDEVGELPLELQAKLLRVLQERTFERVGGSRTLRADVRWIAATNRDLEAMVREGRFREDLYHRLMVFPLRLPPLRERRSDIAPLAKGLLERIGRDLGRPGLVLAEEAELAIAAADWPGNVRELANVLERAAILCDGERLAASDLALAPLPLAAPRAAESGAGDPIEPLELVERRAIERALAVLGGNRRRAAESLGIGVRTLYEKLKRYGLG